MGVADDSARIKSCLFDLGFESCFNFYSRLGQSGDFQTADFRPISLIRKDGQSDDIFFVFRGKHLF